MEDSQLWLIIVGMTLITILTRSLFLLAGASIKISPSLQRAMRFAPAATLIALILPSLITVNNTVTATLINPVTNPKLAASIVAGIVFFHTKNMLLTIAAGMALFTLLRLFAI